MKTLLLTALALTFTTLSARADFSKLDCTLDGKQVLSLRPAGLGRKQVTLAVQGTKVNFQNLSDKIDDFGMEAYLGVSSDGYGMHLSFNSESTPTMGLVFLLTPQGRTVILEQLNCN